MAEYNSLAGAPGDFTVGKGAPRSEATKGITLHHLCVRIKDPVKSLEFYRGVLGMRLLWSYNAGCYSVYYIMHSDQDASEVTANFTSGKGFIELIHRHGSEDEDIEYKSGNEVPHMGFAHMGMIVEDVPKVVERAVAAGSKLIKPQGVSTVETIAWPPGTPEPIEAFHQLYANMAMISDPDGYWVELVPAELKLV